MDNEPHSLALLSFFVPLLSFSLSLSLSPRRATSVFLRAVSSEEEKEVDKGERYGNTQYTCGELYSYIVYPLFY